jgi:hypothetical protein
MNLRTMVLASVVFLFVTSPAPAVRVFGAGLSSCGEWTTARAQQNSFSNLVFSSWLLGYLSGINEALNAFKKADVLMSHDAQGLLAWMDNYCRANPLDKVKRAADELLAELLKRANVR